MDTVGPDERGHIGSTVDEEQGAFASGKRAQTAAQVDELADRHARAP